VLRLGCALGTLMGSCSGSPSFRHAFIVWGRAATRGRARGTGLFCGRDVGRTGSRLALRRPLSCSALVASLQSGHPFVGF